MFRVYFVKHSVKTDKQCTVLINARRHLIYPSTTFRQQILFSARGS